MPSRRAWKGLLWALMMAGAVSALGEEAAQGSKSSARIADRTLSPLAVVSADDLATLGYTTLPQALAQLLPDFVYPQPALLQGTDHSRPLAFRGLAPDQVLVLLNGVRRTSSAWLHRGDSYGQGSLGADLATIPIAAVARIEVLRDGASARWGSGAMAGVINVVLKDAADGGSLDVTFGQYRTHLEGVPDLFEFVPVSSSEFFLFEAGDINTDDGEGDTLTLSGNGGFSLFDSGFLNLSAEYRTQQPTNRSGYDPRHLYPVLPGGDWDPREQYADRRTYRYGNPDQEDLLLLANFATRAGDHLELYGNIGYAARNVASAAAPVLAADPADIPEIYPDGYRPSLDSDDEDRYFSLGLAWHLWGWRWDLGYNQDEYEMDFSLRNSLNPALGVISPTRFEVGNYEGRHSVMSLELARSFEGVTAGPLNVVVGAEYRSSEYENETGDLASYAAEGATTPAGDLRPPGSQGLTGVRRVDDFDEQQINVGAYLNVQAAITRNLTTEVGIRYDDAEDLDFVSGKLAARWAVTDRLTLHGTVSRDFRLPSVAESHLRATELTAVGGSYLEQGLYAIGQPVADALGARPLDVETSVNVSAGVNWRHESGLDLTLGLYRIDIDDQVVLSDTLDQDVLTGIGVDGVRSARYFLNGVDTRVRGLDASASYLWQTGIGALDLRMALNVNEREVGDSGNPAAAPAPDVAAFGASSRTQLESWTPDDKLHLSATWQRERLRVTGRVVRYGKVLDLGETADLDHTIEPDWVLDLDLRYRLTDAAYLGFGVHNFLDAYPDPRPRGDADPVENRLLPYSSYSPYGFNGRFVYLSAGIGLTR